MDEAGDAVCKLCDKMLIYNRVNLSNEKYIKINVNTIKKDARSFSAEFNEVYICEECLGLIKGVEIE